MKIAIFEVEEWEREVFSDHDLVFREETLTADNAGADSEILSTFMLFGHGPEICGGRALAPAPAREA